MKRMSTRILLSIIGIPISIIMGIFLALMTYAALVFGTGEVNGNKLVDK